MLWVFIAGFPGLYLVLVFILQFSDVNECDTSNGNCNQTCINTEGSYNCNCSDGYVIASNGYDCLSMYLFYLSIYVCLCA